MKRCTKCLAEKHPSEFPQRKSRPGGHSWCKSCVSERNRAQYANTRESTLVRKAEYRQTNADRIKVDQATRRKENRDSLNEYFRDYARRNRDKKQSATVARRARKLKATPSWANQNYIALFYKLARIESERLGEQVHVDHIVPLKSSLVCGLHCEHNLQLLTATSNLAKSNRVWPDMP